MTQHKDRTRMYHMRNHAREAIDLTKGKTREDIGNDRTLELALTRLVEIVGEAAARVSRGTQDKHSEIAWPEIIGLRNRLIHGYDAVDLDILWNIIKIDIPDLESSLNKILEQE